MLAKYIADVEKIPFEIATQNIAMRVKSLKSYLTEGETLTFENIGDLTLNSIGKIEFTPSYHLNYLTDAFGLSQYVSPSITREVYKEDVTTLEKEVPTIAITTQKRKSKSYLKYAAVAIIALGLSGFGVNNYYKNIENHNQIAQEEANNQLEDQIQEATFVISNPLPAVTLNVSKQAGNFHVVAGAFRVEENSDKKVNQLRDLGYKARKIGTNKFGLHQVVYGSYSTREEAIKVLNTVRTSSNKDAWLLIKQLD